MFSTIRGRIIAVFAIFLVFVGVLTVFFWWSMGSIRERLYISENFEDLFNQILEARRYEKNFFLYHDQQALHENLVFVKKVGELTDNLSQEMKRVVGRPAFDRFRSNLINYKKQMEEYQVRQTGAAAVTQDEVAVRAEGKAIVDFASNLLKVKRSRIHRALLNTSILPFAFLGVFVVLVALLVRLLSRKVLRPLALIHKTIGQVAEGDFRPMAFQELGRDEISKLIEAFNSMAGELESKQEQLVQSRKIAAIGTFTAGIAHELNNPINNIYLTAETLLEDYESLSKPEGREMVLDVLNQAERAGEIVKNLLDFSRSDLPALVELEVAEVVAKTLKLVKHQVMLAGIKVDVSIPDALPRIRGNFRNLEQIFLNLLINAIQAMPGGGRITVAACREADGYLRIDVQDSGVGIKPEQLEHIFEPFYTTKGVGRGTGLGLAVTYALVKKHGGYVEVRSKIAEGTTFSVYLPTIQSE